MHSPQHLQVFFEAGEPLCAVRFDRLPDSAQFDVLLGAEVLQEHCLLLDYHHRQLGVVRARRSWAQKGRWAALEGRPTTPAVTMPPTPEHNSYFASAEP